MGPDFRAVDESEGGGGLQLASRAGVTGCGQLSLSDVTFAKKPRLLWRINRRLVTICTARAADDKPGGREGGAEESITLRSDLAGKSATTVLSSRLLRNCVWYAWVWAVCVPNN